MVVCQLHLATSACLLNTKLVIFKKSPSGRLFIYQLQIMETIMERELSGVINLFQVGKNELARMLQRNKQIELVYTLCPPYKYDDELKQFVFGEFDLHAGHVAHTLLQQTTGLLHTFAYAGVHTKLTMAYASQEAYDADILVANGFRPEDVLAALSIAREDLFRKAHRALGGSPLLRHYVQVDIYDMPARFPGLETAQAPSRYTSSKLLGVRNHRQDLIMRMFASKCQAEGVEQTVTQRCLFDMAQHEFLGDQLRREAQAGHNVALVTMSPHVLSSFYNYNVDFMVPVANFNQPY